MADLDLSMLDINGNDIGLCYDLCEYWRYVGMGYYSWMTGIDMYVYMIYRNFESIWTYQDYYDCLKYMNV